jgi:tetratricopeptide (TPR) repeat protein
VQQNEPSSEADDLYKKGDFIGGEYEVRGTLGKGGFGHVYLVRHCKTGVVFALKTFRDEFLDDPKARDAFKKEALLWVNLEDHPFILSATVVVEISGRLFVFMKYIAPDAQGRSNLAAGRVQEAIGCCDKALAVDPRDPHAWFCKGSWLLGLGQVEEAYKCCDKALVIDPRHTDALFWKGSQLARCNRHEDAIKLYKEVLAISPRNVGAWHNKGISEDVLGRRREAVNNYRRYLELASPTDAKKIAFIRQRMQELERAL